MTTTSEFRLALPGAPRDLQDAADRAYSRQVLNEPVDVEALNALFEWARNTDFGPDAAQRIRREAWS